MSSEYIFEINDALYDHKTGRVCMMPKIVGKLIRCKDCAKREYCRTTNVWATVPDDDWFCADAERRSDDGL